MRDEELNKLDIFDDRVEFLSEEDKNKLLERGKYLASISIQPTLPCECSWCQDWIEKTDLHYKIGVRNITVICQECAEFLYEQEDNEDKGG